MRLLPITDRRDSLRINRDLLTVFQFQFDFFRSDRKTVAPIIRFGFGLDSPAVVSDLIEIVALSVSENGQDHQQRKNLPQCFHCEPPCKQRLREGGYDACRLSCRNSCSFARAAPVSIERAAISTAPPRLFAAPGTNSDAAALVSTRTRASSLRRPSSTSLMIAASSCAEPPRRWSIDARRSPKSSGLTSNRSTAMKPSGGPSGEAE